MMRVSPPELARALPGPQASTSVTCPPIRRRWRAVQPPKAPAPTTTTLGFAAGAATRFRAGRAADWRRERREVALSMSPHSLAACLALGVAAVLRVILQEWLVIP